MSCEVCNEVQAKYKCPRCSLKTCSLRCVKQHKIAKKCSGVRDKTAYVPIKEFKEPHLLSDYRFLEDVDRKVYTASKDPNLKLPARSNQGWLPNQLHQRRRAARQRGVNLKLLPAIFTRHKANTTRFKNISKGISVLHWRVEWKFPQSEATYVNDGLAETTVLRNALEEYLDQSKGNPVIRQRLKRYCAESIDSVRLFMKVEGTHENKIRYSELKLDQTLADNIVHKCILEFPTIIVVLKQFADEYLDKPETNNNKKNGEKTSSIVETSKDKKNGGRTPSTPEGSKDQDSEKTPTVEGSKPS